MKRWTIFLALVVLLIILAASVIRSPAMGLFQEDKGYLPLIFKNLPPTPTATPRQPPPTWTAYPTPTITPTSPTRTPTSKPTNTPQGQSTQTPTPTPTRTPTPTITPTPTGVYTTGNVTIVTIFYKGSGSQEPDEYVVIRNDDTFMIQVGGWTLRDEANHVFTFPNYIMTPGNACRVYTNENHPEYCGFNYSSGSGIWNNGGDCGYLRDANSTLIDDYCY